MQLEFLWKELGGYKTVLKALIEAKSIREASDAVLTGYEKPANQSDSVKMARAKYGQKYYDQFAGISADAETGNKEAISMSYDPNKVIQAALNEVGYLEKRIRPVWTTRPPTQATKTVRNTPVISTLSASTTARSRASRGAMNLSTGVSSRPMVWRLL